MSDITSDEHEFIKDHIDQLVQGAADEEARILDEHAQRREEWQDDYARERAGKYIVIVCRVTWVTCLIILF